MISKLPYYDLYESVRSAIFENLNHKHAYVRKNALACISVTLQHFGIDSLPNDIIDRLKDLIDKDTDFTVKRSAYLTLSKIDSDECLRVTKELLSKTEITEISEQFILAIIKHLKTRAKSTIPTEKARIIKLMIEFFQHKSNTVQFEIAYSLLDISSSSSIVKHAVNVMSNLLIDINDNNTLLIIIKRLNALKLKYKAVLEENVITYTTILNKSDLTQNIRNIILEMISELISENNINQVLHLLKLQFNALKSTSEGFLEFKFRLLETFFNGIKRFPKVNREFILFFVEKSIGIITIKDKSFKDEQCAFIREVFFLFKDNSADIYEVVLRNFEDVVNQDMLTSLLYILSEYSMNYSSLLRSAFELISKNIGDLELELKENELASKEIGGSLDSLSTTTKTITKTVLLKDGSYGTETTVVNLAELNKKDKSFLRENLLNTNYFFACNVAVAITKVHFSLVNSKEFLEEEFNDYYFRTLSVLCALIRMDSCRVFKDQSNLVRINTCLDLVTENRSEEFFALLKESRLAFESLLEQQNTSINSSTNNTNNPYNCVNNKGESKPLEILVPQQQVNFKNGKMQKPGTFIGFRQLTPYDAENLGFLDDEVEDDYNNKLEEELEAMLSNDSNQVNANLKANSVTSNLNTNVANTASNMSSSNSEKKTFVETLTGSEDHLSVEAVIEIFTFDIVVEFNVKNRSKEDLQNITLELFAPTNLEIIEKAPVFSLKKGESTKVKSCIKFTSSCNSFIFGEISFSNFRGTVYSINLSGVFINLLDTYAAPCSENNFRKCWMNYSWEHKTIIVSKSKSFREFIEFICLNLNLKLIVPKDLNSIDEESAFLVANLFTKSKLGEDALINISVEKMNDKKIVGCAVIRSKIKDFAQFQGEKIKSLVK